METTVYEHLILRFHSKIGDETPKPHISVCDVVVPVILNFLNREVLNVITKNFHYYSSLCEANSEKISRNDVDLFSFQKIKLERRFTNKIHGLVVSWSKYTFNSNILKEIIHN